MNWKSVKSVKYNKIVNNFIANDVFDIVNFVAKMVDKNKKNSYKTFCDLFDADEVYEKVKDLKEEDISDYNETMGWFVRMYEKSEG